VTGDRLELLGERDRQEQTPASATSGVPFGGEPVQNQFSKGDVVTIAGVTGVVEDFSLRRAAA